MNATDIAMQSLAVGAKPQLGPLMDGWIQTYDKCIETEFLEVVRFWHTFGVCLWDIWRQIR